MSVETLLLSLLIGGMLGYYLPFKRTQKMGDGIIFTGLTILLIAIGVQLGGDDQILQNLNMVGGFALVMCLGSIIGSILCVYLSTAVTSVLDPLSASPDENAITHQGSPSER